MPRLAIHMESFSSSNKVEASKPNNYNEIEAVKIGTLKSISPAERGPSAMLRDILTECRGTASEGPRNAGSFLKTSPPSLLGSTLAPTKYPAPRGPPLSGGGVDPLS